MCIASILEAMNREAAKKWFSAFISACKRQPVTQGHHPRSDSSCWRWTDCLPFLPINSPSRNNIRNAKKMDERKADLTSLEGYVTTVAPKYPEKGKGEFTHMYRDL